MAELENVDYLEMTPNNPMELPNILKKAGNSLIIVGRNGISSEKLWEILPTVEANVIFLMDTELYDWKLLVGLWSALRFQREMPKMVVYRGYPGNPEYRYTDDDGNISNAAKLVAEYYPDTNGDILVFLSSEEDFPEMQLLLDTNSKCYRGGRKIILATNQTLIKSSRIGLVIDTMMDTRYRNSTGGGVSLQRTVETKSSADYRRSFTSDICLRMCSELFYLQMEDSPTQWPEDRIALDLKTRGLPLFTDKAEYYSAIIDELGLNLDFAMKVPLSVRNVAALQYWMKIGNDPSGAVAVLSMLDMYGPSPYIAQPGRQPNETDRSYLARVNKAKKFIGRSDIDTFANIMESLLTETTLNDDIITAWSASNGLDPVQMLAAWSKIKSVLSALNLNQLNIFLVKDLASPMRGVLARAYPDRIMTRKESIYYLPGDTREYYIDDRASNTLKTIQPNTLLALVLSEDSTTILVASDLEDEFQRQIASDQLREIRKPPIALRAPARPK